MNWDEPVELSRKLISFDTANPPGNEAACATFLRTLLSQAGFEVTEHAFAERRVSLVAKYGGQDAAHSLCFVGHLDTVPVGESPWKHPPHAAIVENGRLHGRGSCDMKSGVAAFIVAAMRAARKRQPDTSLTLLLCAGEETGCEGSSHLAAMGIELSAFDGIVVAEPTDNVPLLGHKGALWLRVRARGVAAHGAMPHNGVNAAVKAARMILKLQGFCDAFDAHPALGKPTISIGQVRSGNAVNIVPDLAEILVDLRTTPGLDHSALKDSITELLAPDVDGVEEIISLPCVYTEPGNAWVHGVFGAVEHETAQIPEHRTAAYFTDASALSRATAGTPILILGPGSPRLMHQTDEYCEIAQIEKATRIYSRLIDMHSASTRAMRANPQRQAAQV